MSSSPIWTCRSIRAPRSSSSTMTRLSTASVTASRIWKPGGRSRRTAAPTPLPSDRVAGRQALPPIFVPPRRFPLKQATRTRLKAVAPQTQTLLAVLQAVRDDAVAASPLGRVERGVGPPEHGARLFLPVVLYDGHADADRENGGT